MSEFIQNDAYKQEKLKEIIKSIHEGKSVDAVKKEKDVAEFWLTINGKFIHIRYFALYNEKGDYKGVIEVSQDVTDIRGLEGERRLLDW